MRKDVINWSFLYYVIKIHKYDGMMNCDINIIFMFSYMQIWKMIILDIVNQISKVFDLFSIFIFSWYIFINTY